VKPLLFILLLTVARAANPALDLINARTVGLVQIAQNNYMLADMFDAMAMFAIEPETKTYLGFSAAHFRGRAEAFLDMQAFLQMFGDSQSDK
jgi:hypothetical protein